MKNTTKSANAEVVIAYAFVPNPDSDAPGVSTLYRDGNDLYLTHTSVESKAEFLMMTAYGSEGVDLRLNSSGLNVLTDAIRSRKRPQNKLTPSAPQQAFGFLVTLFDGLRGSVAKAEDSEGTDWMLRFPDFVVQMHPADSVHQLTVAEMEELEALWNASQGPDTDEMQAA